MAHAHVVEEQARRLDEQRGAVRRCGPPEVRRGRGVRLPPADALCWPTDEERSKQEARRAEPWRQARCARATSPLADHIGESDVEALCHRLRDTAPARIRLHRPPNHAMQPCSVNSDGSVAAIWNDSFHVAKQPVALWAG
eukprot:scaffold20153_cov63-Phaeocystis_antarctica.AAC.2